MMSCNESSQSEIGGLGSPAPSRAGLRRPPHGVEPTGVFVVIEMTVLFCVSALAMVSIIVSIDDGAAGGRPVHVSRLDDRSPPVAVVRSAPAASPASAAREAAVDGTPTGQAAR